MNSVTIEPETDSMTIEGKTDSVTVSINGRKSLRILNTSTIPSKRGKFQKLYIG